jgi:hypothetical protein
VRPDILAADEPQPIDPLLIREPDGVRAFVHLAPNAAESKTTL